MSSRREFLKVTAGTVAALGSGVLMPQKLTADQVDLSPAGLPSGARDSAVLDRLSGKQPLIKRTYRPPNYESPIEYFDDIFTANERFFVRYHHAGIPKVDAASWMLKQGGEGAAKSQTLSLADLRQRFETVELPALCMCAGNRRGLVDPHVPGIQWGYGAMGNALWRGIRLRDVLRALDIKKEAIEVTFNGADTGVIDKSPDFVKSLPLWKALDENTLIAFEMNGAPLPHWNGFPARLVVPGWTATYWVKHLTEINIVTKPFDGFWIKTAYRIPLGKFNLVDRFASQETDANTPITELVVNSLITKPADGQVFSTQQPIMVNGFAWDGGSGIAQVEASTDGGSSWRAVELGKDYGKYSWRPWSFRMIPEKKGKQTVMIRATNRLGNTQKPDIIATPAGYHHNAIQKITVQIV